MKDLDNYLELDINNTTRNDLICKEIIISNPELIKNVVFLTSLIIEVKQWGKLEGFKFCQEFFSIRNHEYKLWFYFEKPDRKDTVIEVKEL